VLPAACNTQPPDSSVPPTRVATHGKQVASPQRKWRALPKPYGVAHNSFSTAGITNVIQMPAAQGDHVEALLWTCVLAVDK